MKRRLLAFSRLRLNTYDSYRQSKVARDNRNVEFGRRPVRMHARQSYPPQHGLAFHQQRLERWRVERSLFSI